MQKYFDEVKKQIETEKQKAIQEELEKIREANKPKTPVKKLPTTPLKSFQKTSDNPVVLLNKVPPSSSQKIVRSVRRKHNEESQTIQEAPLELLEIDNQQYQIEIIETEDASEIHVEDGSKIEIVEVQEPIEIISEEIIVPKKKKSLKKNEQAKFIVIDEKIVAETYCNVINDEDNPELDENGEKKIFKCAFEKCNEAFSRRQQCKTHYYNHLATEANFSCKYCEKKFKTASALERHERVHTNSKVIEVMKNFKKF